MPLLCQPTLASKGSLVWCGERDYLSLSPEKQAENRLQCSVFSGQDRGWLIFFFLFPKFLLTWMMVIE